MRKHSHPPRMSVHELPLHFYSPGINIRFCLEEYRFHQIILNIFAKSHPPEPRGPWFYRVFPHTQDFGLNTAY